MSSVLNPILDSLVIGLGFFYKALWPLLLGVFFTAVTVTQSLFRKGASTESAFAFSFASTNLVFELGILIYVILGPAFLAAELLGGVFLIALVYIISHLTLPRQVFEEARRRMRERLEGEAGPVQFTQSVSAGGDWKAQLTSRAGWTRIAHNYFHTLGTIYKSALFGVFFAAMTASAVAMEYLFELGGWVPERLSSTDLKSFLSVSLNGHLLATLLMLALTGGLYALVRTGTEEDLRAA